MISLDVFEAIQSRKSVRAYDSRPIPRDILIKILESARLAPSAMNYQPWPFIVVTDENRREILSQARYAKFLREAPIIIIGCGDYKKSPKWYMMDTTIAMQNMVLTATNEGLGSCWIGSFHEDRVRELLKIPDNLKVVALLALGYPRKKFDILAKLGGTHRRKELESIVSYEEFGKRFSSDSD